MAYKYGGDFETAVLANANCGGEAQARGAVLASLLGAACGASRIPAHLKEGLKDSEDIARDIDAFVAAIPHKPQPRA